MTDGAMIPTTSGCSKRLSSKAAASEEARRYGPHFVGPFALVIDLGERKSPSSASDFRTTLVEPLSEARTPLAAFFSIMLGENAGVNMDKTIHVVQLTRFYGFTLVLAWIDCLRTIR
jgi:hypothetical protein